jgi:NAD(P)H dehydrogenase (quinone)
LTSSLPSTAPTDQRVRDAGMDEHQRETLIKMFRAYARDGLKGNPNVLSWLLGRSPTSTSAFAARTAAAHI